MVRKIYLPDRPERPRRRPRGRRARMAHRQRTEISGLTRDLKFGGQRTYSVVLVRGNQGLQRGRGRELEIDFEQIEPERVMVLTFDIKVDSLTISMFASQGRVERRTIGGLPVGYVVTRHEDERLRDAKIGIGRQAQSWWRITFDAPRAGEGAVAVLINETKVTQFREHPIFSRLF